MIIKVSMHINMHIVGTIPLGIQFENEGKLQHKAEIFDDLNKYIPVLHQNGVTLIPHLVFSDYR